MKRVDGAGLIATSFRSLPAFGVTVARDIGEAVRALAAHDGAAVLSGGADLVAQFNEGFAPTHLVDISRIDAMKSIEHRNGCLWIGACVTHQQGSASAVVQSTIPGFAGAWRKIANVRIRMSATIGGNLMARRTRYEGAILLSALAARLQFESANGPCDIAVEDIWDAVLPAGALLTAIRIPLRDGLRLDYERSLRPVMTQALAIDLEGIGRLVTATEFTRPRPLDISPGAGYQPYAIGDPVAGDDYLNHTAGVFMRRQLARLAAS